MDTFATDLRARFENRLVAHVEEAYPEKVWDIALSDLGVRIHRAIDQAITYGIKIEEDVATFVDLTFELGQHFDTDPEHEWAQPILRDPNLEGHEKVNMIEEALYQMEDNEAVSTD
jgi:hypothetical protein